MRLENTYTTVTSPYGHRKFECSYNLASFGDNVQPNGIDVGTIAVIAVTPSARVCKHELVQVPIA